MSTLETNNKYMKVVILLYTDVMFRLPGLSGMAVTSISNKQGHALRRKESSSRPPRLIANCRSVDTSGGVPFRAFRIMFFLCLLDGSSTDVTAISNNHLYHT